MNQIVLLTEGVEIKGKRYRVAVLRTPIMKDSLDAESMAKDKGALYFSMCLMLNTTAELRESEEDGAAVAPRKELSIDHFAQLNEIDMERLHDGREWLKKKVSWMRE